MTGKFRIAKGWRIFIYLCSPLLIGLFGYLGFIAIHADNSNLTTQLILLPVSLGGTVMFLYGLAETVKGRLIIDENSISIVGIFSTKKLYFQEIKGFRMDNNNIVLDSNTKKKKSLRISTYTEKSDQIATWISNQFLELDSYEALEEEQKILARDEFGITRRVREDRLNQARSVAKVINIFGGLTGAWLWFYPRPYEFCLSVGMVVPVLALLSLYLYRGLIRFDEKKNSAHPSIIYGFLFSALGLLIRSIMDYELLEYRSAWTTIGIVTFILSILLIVGTGEFKFNKIADYFTFLSSVGLIIAYSYGTYTITNCLFDKSKGEIFGAKVMGKEISSGKSTTYYLLLGAWGPRVEAEKVTVTKDEYESTVEGETVYVHVKPGLLKTPWFYIVTE